MIGLPISIFITGDRAKAFDWISVTTVGIALSIDAMTNFLDAIRIHYMSIFIKRVRLAKMMLGEYTMRFGSRVMNIFTKRAGPAKMMLGEASSPFFIPVAGQC